MEEEQYYKEIKNILINNEVYKRVKDYSKNRSDLLSYYNVGKLIVEAQGGEKRAKYGDQLIKEYSKKLIIEVGKKYTDRYLRDMRKFYLKIKEEIWKPTASKLSWSHYIELLPIKDINEIKYYINKCIEYNLSRNKLRELIKSKEYKRLPKSTKNKLINNEETRVEDLVKNPIIIKLNNKEVISEKILQQLILDDIEFFLKELGDGFTFVGSEYPIKIDNNYNYIDLLLYNIIFNCYVVTELKVTELRKEYIGQVEVYKNYIDEHLKTKKQNNTIGIILYKEGNNYLLHYCTDENIFATKYITI